MISRGYAAGIMDGEGSIGLTRCRTSVYPRVLVVNTDLELLEDFREEFGGDINPLRGNATHVGWRKAWSWRLSWTAAVDFVEWIYPELRVKRAQAETVFAWDACRPGSGKRWDEETRELLVERMSWLNRRGIVTTPDPIEAVA